MRRMRRDVKELLAGVTLMVIASLFGAVGLSIIPAHFAVPAGLAMLVLYIVAFGLLVKSYRPPDDGSI